MTDADAAISAAPPDTTWFASRLELFGLLALSGAAAALQFSIAAGQILLALAIACWLALVVVGRERVAAPRFFWPLLAYAALTLVSAAFSLDPRISFADCKQLALFLIVPVAYRLVPSARRGETIITVVVSVGAASAAFGIFQYGLLHYDYLGQRPQGTLGHYMTYSGLLMLVTGIALARVLFGRSERVWAALVTPALVVALAVTQTRSAWVGVSAAVGLLLVLKDFRLLALLPIAAAALFVVAPPYVAQRFASMFDPSNATRSDRVAMLQEGAHMVRDHPLVGVGPNMVKERYAEYRVPEAVEQVNPHLHNVPMQIAAERGIPALAAWLAFIVMLTGDVSRRLRIRDSRMLAAAALAAIVGMLAAGMFEYNFGDSEFLMLFLIVVTLPFAAARRTEPPAAA